MAYIRKRGTLNTGMRVEHGAALIACVLANINSKKGGFKVYDFMPHEEEPPETLEQAMDTWK